MSCVRIVADRTSVSPSPSPKSDFNDDIFATRVQKRLRFGLRNGPRRAFSAHPPESGENPTTKPQVAFFCMRRFATMASQTIQNEAVFAHEAPSLIGHGAVRISSLSSIKGNCQRFRRSYPIRLRIFHALYSNRQTTSQPGPISGMLVTIAREGGRR